MRTRDDEKKEALFEATVKLVNEIGFVSSSVSKIAKEARVSPATLYVYYKNKEDLLVSTYIDLKLDLSQAILDDLDETLPIRDIMRNVWFGFLNIFPTTWNTINSWSSLPIRLTASWWTARRSSSTSNPSSK